MSQNVTKRVMEAAVAAYEAEWERRKDEDSVAFAALLLPAITAAFNEREKQTREAWDRIGKGADPIPRHSTGRVG